MSSTWAMLAGWELLRWSICFRRTILNPVILSVHFWEVTPITPVDIIECMHDPHMCSIL